MLEAMNRAWRTARGDYREEPHCGLPLAFLLLITFGGGAATLLAIGVFLALEPVR